MNLTRNSRTYGTLAVLLTASLLWSAVFADTPPLPKANLTIKSHTMTVEMATTPRQRERGLMYRKTLPPNSGMLFQFEQKNHYCMWMKNTYLPLSVAFIDEDGTILNIEDMAPRTTDPHCASQPAVYALEMNRGWFKRRQIQPGDQIQGIPDAIRPKAE